MKTGRRRNLRRRRASVHRTPLWITAALLALAVVVTAFHVGRRYSVSHAEPGPARYTVPGTAERSFWRDPFARLSGPDLPVVEVAIVIDDLGASLPNALELIDISPKFTLAVLPWQGASEEILAEARARGVETILHQPMEPHARQPRRIEGMLLRRMSAGEIRAVLTENLDRYPGIAGINNHMGSAFTEDRRAMDAVMKVLAERGLVFLDSMTTARSVGADAARAARGGSSRPSSPRSFSSAKSNFWKAFPILRSRMSCLALSRWPMAWKTARADWRRSSSRCTARARCSVSCWRFRSAAERASRSCFIPADDRAAALSIPASSPFRSSSKACCRPASASSRA